MTKKKRWSHLSNVTDDMLISWNKLSALQKLQWLEDARLFYKAAVPKKKRMQLRKAGIIK